MTTRTAPVGVASHEHLHGDEPLAPEFTAAEQRAIEARTDELLAERIADRSHFDDLLAGLDANIFNHDLHRALMNLDLACRGQEVAIIAVLTALSNIQREIQKEAAAVWLEECEQIATSELT